MRYGARGRHDHLLALACYVPADHERRTQQGIRTTLRAWRVRHHEPIQPTPPARRCSPTRERRVRPNRDGLAGHKQPARPGRHARTRRHLPRRARTRDPRPGTRRPLHRTHHTGAGMISDLKPHYRTGRDDLRKDFFTRCLADCTTYERAAGYFSSTALLSWADALRIPKRLDELRIKLLISPALGRSDLDALRTAIDPQQRVLLVQHTADQVVLDVIELLKTT